MKKSNYLPFSLLVISIFLLSAINLSAQFTHGSDISSSFYPNQNPNIRHFEAAQYGFGSGNRIFLSGRQHGSITWNGYPSGTYGAGSKYIVNGLTAFQVRYEAWHGNSSGDNSLVFEFSSKLQNPVIGDDIIYNKAFRLNHNGEAFFYGTVWAPEVKVRNITWWDRVFEPNYKLMSLSDLESYIKINKHLPDIPSEKEIIDGGLNIGEMQSLQMKKIEELTLYVIEQNKKIQELEEKLAILNEKLITE